MNKEVNYYQVNKLPGDNNEPGESMPKVADIHKNKVRFEIFGEEMVEKTVKLSGTSARAYVPPIWLGHKVKIIRID